MALPEATIENRIHPRFEILNPLLAKVRFPDGQSAPIRDVSYSGFSIEEMIGSSFSGSLKLDFFGVQQSAQASLVHEQDRLRGFCFQHKTPEVLVFLQPFIERLRVGASLVQLGGEVVADKFRAPEWIVLRGDGPVDVVIQTQGDKLYSALITFRDGHEYKELRLKQGVVHTGSQGDAEGVAARIISDHKPDRNIVRQAIYILSGIIDKDLKLLMNQFISAAIKATTEV